MPRPEAPPRREIEEQTRRLNQVWTHPRFIELIQDLEETPENERPEVARRLVTRDELDRRGIPIPPGVRITTRWFEDPRAQTLESPLVDSGPDIGPRRPPINICVSAGFYVCASCGADV
jgi:hypothetical protein